MFTGIITDLGTLQSTNGSRFVFSVDESFGKKLENGTSVAVNGACLTVTDKPNKSSFAVDIMPETAQKTILGNLNDGDLVNLELPATIETLFSGHIVQGHIDGTGKITAITDDGNSKILTIAISQELQKYIVEKGSVALNGISLTVIESTSSSFTVGIIPFSWTHTMLHQTKVGDEVNIETDVIAKYVEKLVKQ